MLTFTADNCGFELTNHNISDEWLDSFWVVVLSLLTHLFIGFYVISYFKGLFFLYQVQILLKAIDQIADKLLGILLTIAWKLSCKLSYFFLEASGSQGLASSCPHLPDKFSIGTGQITFGSKRVRIVDVTFELIIHEVVSQFPSVAQTLKAAIHVAGVSKIFQSNYSFSSSIIFFFKVVFFKCSSRFSQVWLFSLTFCFMVLPILFQAFHVAIFDCFALTQF